MYGIRKKIRRILFGILIGRTGRVGGGRGAVGTINYEADQEIEDDFTPNPEPATQRRQLYLQYVTAE